MRLCPPFSRCAAVPVSTGAAAATCLLALMGLLAAPLAAQDQDLPSIEEKTAGFAKLDGYFPLYWDEAAGRVWLEISRFDDDFLYAVSLPAGLGSNDVGLDRGQLGEAWVVRFERTGPRVLLVAPNLRYRAVSDDAQERQAVRNAFAESVLWGFTVAARTEGRVLVDATDFIVRDAHGIARRLQETDQGTFQLDAERSTPYPAMTKAFPENTEMEARLTFTGDRPGPYVRDVTPDPYAVTLRVRHSFVKLPDDGYTPRPMDPRSGFFGIEYADYATPIGEPLVKQFIARHRLQKKNPAAAVSEPVEPIVYYLDPGTPEPVRSALLEGASWWAQAFEAAGFKEAFRVELLPAEADPMDVRYNVIQWVHRATRGWSYGGAVIDPRTGEIIKGHVTLGSLRVRQDYLIAEGLLAPYDAPAHSRGRPPEDDPMLQMALARLRQLAAHEVGHTLGLNHNFAASAAGRASVMDYPAPLAVVADGGAITLDSAYARGVGAWDVAAIRYGYAQLSGDEQAGLEAILREARDAGLAYVTDDDARPAGGAHPAAHLWDNGADVVAALRTEMAVRQAALARFGPATVREGRPLAQLEEVLVPLYLRHRYQVEAAVKLLGGVDYRYALRGDDQPAPTPVPAARQWAALDALLETLTPAALRLPPGLQIPPRPPGYAQHRELFDGHTGLPFDPYAPAEAAAAMTLGLLVHPERAARLAYQADFDPALPDLHDVLDRITERVWHVPVAADPYDAELQRIVQQGWTDALLEAAARDDLAPAVRARVMQHLHDQQAWLRAHSGSDAETLAHRTLLAAEIGRYLNRPYDAQAQPEALDVPPGSPIGQNPPAYVRRQQQRRALLERWYPVPACSYLFEHERR